MKLNGSCVFRGTRGPAVSPLGEARGNSAPAGSAPALVWSFVVDALADVSCLAY